MRRNILERPYNGKSDPFAIESVDSMLREAAVSAASIARDNATNGQWGSICIQVWNEKRQMIVVATVTVDVERVQCEQHDPT